MSDISMMTEIEALRAQVAAAVAYNNNLQASIEDYRTQLTAMTQERNDLLAEKPRWIARANNYLGQACEKISAHAELTALLEKAEEVLLYRSNRPLEKARLENEALAAIKQWRQT